MIVAHGAKELSAKNHNKVMERVENMIKSTAENGNYECVIFDDLTQEDITYLLNCGYAISKSKDIPGKTIHIISWI
jgi:Skp family chaperone for outer membrane proteins